MAGKIYIFKNAYVHILCLLLACIIFEHFLLYMTRQASQHFRGFLLWSAINLNESLAGKATACYFLDTVCSWALRRTVYPAAIKDCKSPPWGDTFQHFSLVSLLQHAFLSYIPQSWSLGRSCRRHGICNWFSLLKLPDFSAQQWHLQSQSVSVC